VGFKRPLLSGSCRGDTGFGDGERVEEGQDSIEKAGGVSMSTMWGPPADPKAAGARLASNAKNRQKYGFKKKKKTVGRGRCCLGLSQGGP